ncbi:FHA domain-containing protein [Pengzhenrongella frigida]|uniref:FHA domain-containing protein n=1 Tax=Pengzhenrongella frigida TaxID=1259133 RepID=A0A4Q5MYH4_9MICO|nr:FHA domain-containing protein [Cellulomonas sp. HLT2-17]RYV49963.1 FHA domain-containing protein [Cellulomonas sp. HLT2-17]
MGRFEVLEPSGLRPQSRTITSGQVVLGRSPGVDWLLDEPTVSPHHAVVRHYADHDEIEDLGSTAGTQVNGQPLSGSRTLRPGDVVQLAAVHLRYLGEHGPTEATSGPTAVTAPSAPSFTVGGQRGQTISNVGHDQDNQYLQQVIVYREQGLQHVASMSRAARILILFGSGLSGLGIVTFIGSLVVDGARSTQVDLTDPDAFAEAARLSELYGIPVFAIGFGTALIGAALFLTGMLVQLSAATQSRRINRDYPLPPMPID